MAKTNYSFEKRQREIARKKKQDEKRQKKQKPVTDTTTPDGTDEPAPPTDTPSTS